MKKIVLTAVITGVLIFSAMALALPFWFGMETEKTYSAMLEQLSRGSGLQFTGQNYDRGWFSSTAETVVRHPQMNFQITARHQIHHGPLPLDALMRGEWRPAQAHIMSQVSFNAPDSQAPRLPPVTVAIVFHLNGSGTMHAEMPALKKTGEQGQIIDWRGMDADASFDREWKKIRLEARLPSLTLSAPDREQGLVLSKARLHYDMQEGTAGYFFGDGALTVGQLEITGPAGRMSLEALEISTSARPEGDNVNLNIGYKLGQARAGEESYGPAQLAMELRRLDAAAMRKFSNEINGISRGNLPAPQAAMMVAGKTLELIGTLAKKAPELEITHLSFKTRAGEVTGKAKFVLDGRNSNLAENPLQLLLALAGDAEVAVPPAVVKQWLTPLIRRDIDAQRQRGALSATDMAKLDSRIMDEIVDRVFPQYLSRHEFTRLLVEDQGLFKLTLSLHRGQFLLNGKPWRLPARANQVL